MHAFVLVLLSALLWMSLLVRAPDPQDMPPRDAAAERPVTPGEDAPR